MRVSVRKNDPGYRSEEGITICYNITLNGKHIPDCFTADEELGEAHCLIRDDAGKKTLKEIIHKGEVKITPKS